MWIDVTILARARCERPNKKQIRLLHDELIGELGGLAASEWKRVRLERYVLLGILLGEGSRIRQSARQ